MTAKITLSWQFWLTEAGAKKQRHSCIKGVFPGGVFSDCSIDAHSYYKISEFFLKAF